MGIFFRLAFLDTIKPSGTKYDHLLEFNKNLEIFLYVLFFSFTLTLANTKQFVGIKLLLVTQLISHLQKEVNL